MPKENRGGKRQGAGRKAGPARVAITVRIKPAAAEKLNAHCAANKTSQACAVESWALSLKDMKIHPNKKDALLALEEYKTSLAALIERTGVYEECEDSCANVYAVVSFYGDDGKTVCRYSE